MSFTIPPGPLAPVYRLDDFRSAEAPEPAIDPVQVWSEVMAAAQLFGELRAAGMSVRFDTEQADSPPRVCITDLQGRTLRELSSAVACDPKALHAEVLGAAAVV